MTLFAGPASKQNEPFSDSEILFRLDSLERSISKRILSETDKREIRACGRGKSDFLRRLRAQDSTYAHVDRDLNAAKLAGADPNQPSILALMEKKFAFEKSFDDRYASTPKGKACIQGESKRRKALASALEKDQEYQAYKEALQGKSAPRPHGAAMPGTL